MKELLFFTLRLATSISATAKSYYELISPMKPAFAYSTPMFLALSISACGSYMNPDIQQNPHPRLRYDITMTIDDVPGPFDSVTGFVQYSVTNKNCAPEDPIAGVTVTPSIDPPIIFTRVSDHLYRATVYADLIKDEDYYGKGVCRWAMTGVVGALKTNGVTLSPDISSDQIASNESSTSYFSKKFYNHSDEPDLIDPGIPYSTYATEVDRSEFFAITMTAKESFE